MLLLLLLLLFILTTLPPHHAAIASEYESADTYVRAEDKIIAEIDVRENFMIV